MTVKTGDRMTGFALSHHRLVTLLMVAATLAVLLAAAVPSLRQVPGLPGWVYSLSETVDFLPQVRVDTDPENMLAEDEAVRVFHDRMKEKMGLHDMIVVGVINEKDPDGVFNPATLKKVHELTAFAADLQYDGEGNLVRGPPSGAAGERTAGEPAADGPAEPAVEGLPAPPGKESGEPAVEGLPEPSVEGLDEPAVEGLDDTEGEKEAAGTPPAETPAAGETLRGVVPGDVIAPSTVDAIEPRSGTLVFEWLMKTPPETREEAREIRRKAMRVPFLKGTMISEDGKALAIYLPITEKKLSYRMYSALNKKIAALPAGDEEYHITGLPVAEDTFGVEMFKQMAVSAPIAMGLIFLLMLFFFRKLIVVISPMIAALVTVIITMGSLVLSGFPIHIMSSMIPIFLMPIAVLDSIHIISEFFEVYQRHRDRTKAMTAVMEALFMPMLYTSLTSAAGFASLALTPIPPVQVFGVFVAAGIMLAWLLTVTFIPAFVMFISPRRLENFGRKTGGQEQDTALGRGLNRVGRWTARRARPIIAAAAIALAGAVWGITLINVNDNPVEWFEEDHPIRRADRVLNEHFGGTYMAFLAMDAAGGGDEQVFKQPEVLRWQAGLQESLEAGSTVGKSNALADIVKTVHRDLLADAVDDPQIDSYFRIPDSRGAVAECLMQFQSSHRYADIDHFVTPDYRTSSVWFQLTSGDNRDMAAVVRQAEQYVADNPPPVDIDTRWFGLTYINVVWQDRMVNGMLEALSGSFIVVFLLMTFLFRSPLWGLLCMVPLTVTLAGIYGVIGLVGKDYDMPVAVLSSLTLGLAVDFAIHFLARSRELYRAHGSWEKAAAHVFGEPARAITRNIIVIAAGFTPLLLAPLVPYQTVGTLLATILLVSGAGTLLILPALVQVLRRPLFRALEQGGVPSACRCGICLTTAIVVVGLLAFTFYSHFGWAVMTWLAAGGVVAAGLVCLLLSRRQKCRMLEKTKNEEETDDQE